MRVAFVVNSVKQEHARFTTVLLAHRLHQQGHDTWFLEVSSLEYFAGESVGGRGIRPRGTAYQKTDTDLRALQSTKAERKMLSAEDLDIVFGNDLFLEPESRHWAKSAGVMFGQLAAVQGVIGLNDPFTLANAETKRIPAIPAAARPRCIVSRQATRIRDFVKCEEAMLFSSPCVDRVAKMSFC